MLHGIEAYDDGGLRRVAADLELTHFRGYLTTWRDRALCQHREPRVGAGGGGGVECSHHIALVGSRSVYAAHSKARLLPPERTSRGLCVSRWAVHGRRTPGHAALRGPTPLQGEDPLRLKQRNRRHRLGCVRAVHGRSGLDKADEPRLGQPDIHRRGGTFLLNRGVSRSNLLLLTKRAPPVM